jgi:hypothetical protein
MRVLVWVLESTKSETQNIEDDVTRADVVEWVSVMAERERARVTVMVSQGLWRLRWHMSGYGHCAFDATVVNDRKTAEVDDVGADDDDEGVGLGVGDAVDESVGLGVGDGVGDDVGLGVGDVVDEGTEMWVGDGVGESVGLWVLDAVVEGVGLVVGDCVWEGRDWE